MGVCARVCNVRKSKFCISFKAMYVVCDHCVLNGCIVSNPKEENEAIGQG